MGELRRIRRTYPLGMTAPGREMDPETARAIRELQANVRTPDVEEPVEEGYLPVPVMEKKADSVISQSISQGFNIPDHRGPLPPIPTSGGVTAICWRKPYGDNQPWWTRPGMDRWYPWGGIFTDKVGYVAEEDAEA